MSGDGIGGVLAFLVAGLFTTWAIRTMWRWLRDMADEPYGLMPLLDFMPMTRARRQREAERLSYARHTDGMLWVMYLSQLSKREAARELEHVRQVGVREAFAEFEARDGGGR